MTKEAQFAVLFKFGKKRNLEDFRGGILYMNSQAYFSKLEHDPVRHDPFEGTDEIHQPKDIKEVRIRNNVTNEEIVLKSASFAGPLRMAHGKRTYNLFCMYAITHIPESGKLDVDERNFDFGDSFCLVLNTQEFLKRIASAIDAVGLGSEGKLVEYYDPHNYSGETGPFRKPSTHSYQQEFRLAVHPGSAEPLRLLVGDLTDITTPIYSLQEINSIASFSRDVARQHTLSAHRRRSEYYEKKLP